MLRRVVRLYVRPCFARLMRTRVSRLSFLPLFHGTFPCTPHSQRSQADSLTVGLVHVCGQP